MNKLLIFGLATASIGLSLATQPVRAMDEPTLSACDFSAGIKTHHDLNFQTLKGMVQTPSQYAYLTFCDPRKGVILPTGWTLDEIAATYGQAAGLKVEPRVRPTITPTPTPSATPTPQPAVLAAQTQLPQVGATGLAGALSALAGLAAGVMVRRRRA
jgi:hypothetical protein